MTGSEESYQKVLPALHYNPKVERPLVAQIFGSKPELFYKATKIVKDLGFDGYRLSSPNQSLRGLCELTL